MWASIIKWAISTILVPIIHKFIDAWLKARERTSRLKELVKKNEHKTEAYEKDPSSDDSFSNLP